MSRGLWLNVCEGGHGTFVKFFHRRDAENSELSLSLAQQAAPNFSLESVSVMGMFHQLTNPSVSRLLTIQKAYGLLQIERRGYTAERCTALLPPAGSHPLVQNRLPA